MCCPDTPQSIFSSPPLSNLNTNTNDADKDPYLGHRPIALAFAKFIETTPCLLRLSFPGRVSDASPALSTISVDYSDAFGSFSDLDFAREKTRLLEDERLDMYIARVVHWCQVPTIVPYAALYILTALARSFADSLECSVPGACSCSAECPEDVPRHSSRPAVRPRSFSSPFPERRSLRETIASSTVPPPPPPTPTLGSITRTSKFTHALSFSLIRTRTRTRPRARAFSSPSTTGSASPFPTSSIFPSMKSPNSIHTPTPTQTEKTPALTPHLLFLSSFLLTLKLYNNPSSNQHVPPPHTLSRITRIGPEVDLEGLRGWMDGLVSLCDATPIDDDNDDVGGVRRNVEGMVKDRWMGRICALEVPACACQRSRLGLGPARPGLRFGRARSASVGSGYEYGSGGVADAKQWAVDHGGWDEGLNADVDGMDTWSESSESQNQQNWWSRWLNGSIRLSTTTATMKKPNSRRSSIGSMWDALSSAASYSSSSSSASSP
ncbi:hypothetical protein P691DRAFT_778301 [Macrolepiota fuliginosa MF-IS2]|uniref:Uncharacterized protein n=1 Tax=Macrolepiota fuliginosa MF-IS2 TaxID=1400762 RepID=A0A9P5X4N1_9AGAR|nr:hypothetical protein P691DRAFT_778301 [Macrolepiota fuliginosa MF-IS2]